MVTQAQLKRLLILVASVGAFLFAGLAGYARHEAHSTQELVTILYQNWETSASKCESDRTSIYCESIDSQYKEFNDTVEFRDKRDADATTYFLISIIIPFTCIFLWFGGRWVVTGSAN